MLALDYIKANRETVERAIRDKNVGLDLGRAARARRGSARRQDRDRSAAGRAERASAPSSRTRRPKRKPSLAGRRRRPEHAHRQLENELAGKEGELEALMLKLPGIPYEGAPVGPDESFNDGHPHRGEPRKFDFEPLDHVALIEKNGWADLSRVTQVSGSRTYCLKGALALLETKLMGWALEKISDAGFYADHRSGDRARAGIPQPGPVPRPRGRNLPAAQ